MQHGAQAHPAGHGRASRSCIVTHDQVEALSMSDTIVVMSEGQIQQIGSPRERLQRAGQNAFRGGLHRREPTIARRHHAGRTIRVDVHRAVRLISAWTRGLPRTGARGGGHPPRGRGASCRPEEGSIGAARSRPCTFMGVHYGIIIDINGFKWMIQTTDYVDDRRSACISSRTPSTS